MSDIFSQLSANISRQIWEEKHGMTDALRHKINRLPRTGKSRKITPAEYRALCAIHNEPDENGCGWFNDASGHQVMYGPDKLWRLT